MNMPWAATKVYAAPLSKPNDGVNDIITSRRQQGAGNCSLMSLLLAIEKGEYFNEQTGALLPSNLINYHKSDEWVLDPHLKGPHPEHPRQPGYEHSESAVYSIDGERYLA